MSMRYEPERVHAEQRGAKAGAFVLSREADRHSEGVGEHLPPQGAAGEAAGRADLANLVARSKTDSSTRASCWHTPSALPG